MKAIIWDDDGYWMTSGRERFKKSVVISNHKKLALNSLEKRMFYKIQSLAFLMSIFYPELDSNYDLMREDS